MRRWTVARLLWGHFESSTKVTPESRFGASLDALLCFDFSERAYNCRCEILHNQTDEGRHALSLHALRASRFDVGFSPREWQLPNPGRDLDQPARPFRPSPAATSASRRRVSARLARVESYRTRRDSVSSPVQLSEAQLP